MNDYIYALTSSSGPWQIAIISGTTRVAVLTFGSGGFNFLEGPWIDDVTGYVYVAIPGTSPGSIVFVINGTSILANFTIGEYPNSGLYDSGNGDLYLVNGGSGNVSVVVGTAVVSTISVGTQPSALGVDSATGCVYVSNSDSVTVINGTTVVATVPVGVDPSQPVWDSQDGFVYVVNRGSENVSVMNRSTVIATLDVGLDPQLDVYDNTTGFVYVSNEDGTISAIRGMLVLATVSYTSYVGPQGGADYNPRSGYLYFPDPWDSSLAVLDGPQFIARVHIPQYGYVAYASAVFNAQNGYEYVASAYPGTASPNATMAVLDNTTVLSTVRLSGSEAGEPTYDPANGLVYVSSILSGNVSVVNATTTPTYSVEFTAKGLGPSTVWSISINGTTEYSTGPAITVWEPNGSYSYTVQGSSGYSPTSTGGEVVVSGGAPVEELSFTPPPLTILGLSPLEFGLTVAAVTAVTSAIAIRISRRTRAVRPPPSG